MNINVNSTQADSALALLPMFVPGALTSVQPTGFAHLGAPLVIYPATTGLAMVIDPVTTLSTTLTAFDTVVIWLNGQPTSAIKIIQPGEENDRILMYLPPGLLVNGINTMFYRVTRPSGNFEDSTPILNVLFNNPAPNITVSHPASIGPGQPAVITLTVGYARPYDTVTLTIGTWSITFTNPDPTKPITHTLTAAELQQIGDGTHSVSARVIDQLTNSNVSPTTSITISANQKVYNPPIIVEGEPGKILDVAALNGKDATIHGLTWTRIASGQQVWLKLAGHKPDGSTVTLQIWNGGGSQVNATWVSQGFWPKPLPASFLALLADASSLRMEFWVSEDKSNNFATATKFADQVYTIKAEALVDPIIEKVNENTALGALVPDGESTYATTLVISGTASAGRQLQVLKNGAVIDTITVSVTGTFSYTHADATLGARSYTVRGIYGNSPVSSPYNLTRVNPLSFGSNRTLATSNYHVAQNRPPANPNSTATYTQVAAGGTPPYSYSSSNTGVAVIDGNGRVRAVGNGQAVMTVEDSKRMRASHTVSVSGVVIYYHAASWGAQIMNNAAAMAQSLGGRLPSRAELHALHATYRPEGQPDVVLGWMRTHPFWTYEGYPLVNHFWTVYFGNSQESFAHSWQGPSAVAVRLN